MRSELPTAQSLILQPEQKCPAFHVDAPLLL